MIYLDTNALVWLGTGAVDKFSSKALELIHLNEVRFSPMAKLELHFLFQIGRFRWTSDELINDLKARIQIVECLKPFSFITHKATTFDWTRDPFDRIIVAHAMLDNSVLITRDERILENYRFAVC